VVNRGSVPSARDDRTADTGWRRLSLVGGVLLAFLSVGYAVVGDTTPAAVLAGTTLVAASFLVAGAIAWDRRPANRTGPLMVATGLSLVVGLIQGPPLPLLSPLGVLGGTLSGVLLGYLILAFPSGELRSTADRWFIAATAVLLSATNLARLAAYDPSTDGLAYTNPYLVITDPASMGLTLALERAVTVTILLGFLVIFIGRWADASGPMRRVLGPVLAPATVLVLAVIASVAADGTPLPADLKALLYAIQILARAAIPIGFLVGLLRTRIARSAVADLVVELGATPSPVRLRDALAQAFGDPTLAIAYWSPTTAAYVDLAGAPVTLPADVGGRTATLLERDGAPLVAIIHDSALLEDPGLVASVASAMRLAVENERLQVELGEQLEEVRASRARIVAAGEAERKRVERDLHDGAQQRLVSLTLAVRLARTKLGGSLDPDVGKALDDATEQAKAALTELRELARGIHPQILTEAGLTAALESLADRSSLKVTVNSGTVERFSPAIEGTAYFVVSEALANVAKYGLATEVTVSTARDDGTLRVEIADDGVGGASLTSGGGLRGLSDRLAAIDGTLEIISPQGGGTRVIALIPTAAHHEDQSTASGSERPRFVSSLASQPTSESSNAGGDPPVGEESPGVDLDSGAAAT
jgi:signal transduction histidine kinase